MLLLSNQCQRVAIVVAKYFRTSELNFNFQWLR